MKRKPPETVKAQKATVPVGIAKDTHRLAAIEAKFRGMTLGQLFHAALLAYIGEDRVKRLGGVRETGVGGPETRRS